jgi:hypothetical protein
MVKTFLVGLDIERGTEILQALDAAKYPYSVALWRFDEDADRWDLVVGTPVYDKLGIREAYRLFLEAIHDSRLTLGDIPLRLLGNRNPFVRSLRKIFGKAASVEGMQLGGQSIGGEWVDAAYVYRIKK